MKNKSPKFTEQEELNICKEYESGISTIQLAKKYKCATWGKIHSILKRHGKKCRDRCHQSTDYKINETYFDVIDTEEKAYFLGILFADGGNIRNSILLALKRDDEYILNRLNSLFQNKPTRQYSTYTTEYSRLDICNKYIVNKLTEYGIVPKKSLILEFPPESVVPTHLHNHFIRGYYDGDGCLVINKNQIGGKGLWNIVSTKKFLTKCQEIIKLNTKANTQITEISTLKNKNNISTKRLISCGNNQILKILDWIYKNSTIHLERKFSKYQELINIQSNR
jgi:hypothetical protein